MIKVETGQIWFKTDIEDHFYLINLVSKFNENSQYWFGIKMETGQESNIWIYSDIDKLISGANNGD